VDWQQALRETRRQAERTARLKAPEEAFTRSLETIQSVIADATRVTNRLLGMQQEFSAQQERVASRLGSLGAAMDALRQKTFRRNTYSLFSPDFYRQFSSESFGLLLDNSRAILRLPDGFFKEQGWVALLQGMTALFLGGLLAVYRRRKVPVADELSFLLRHPWAGGIFLGLLAFSVFYATVPPLWSWLQTVLIVVAATLLIVSMYRQALVRRVIRILSVIYLLSVTLTMLGLPRPMQQVYLTLLCFGALLGFTCLVRRAARHKGEVSSSLMTAFFAGALCSLVGLIAELAGFATFAANLVDAVLGTIILLLATHMAIRLSDGVLATVLERDEIRSRQFMRLLGEATTRRLQTLVRIFLLANGLVYLFVVWNMFSSHKEAWQNILAWEFRVGEFSVTVQMVSLLLLVIYLSTLVSWVMQALADSAYMTPRNMDFGVKTALKRLLHYALFTAGFFVAVSMAGLDLQKFTIIAGALSVGIGFGLQNIVNNFVSGLILLFERPVKVGDTINIDEQWGTITKIGLRSTVFETLDRAEIIVPNSELISQKVINWTLSNSVSRIVLPVGVAYGSRLEQVLKILTDVARQHPDVIDSPESSAIFTGFGNSSIDFELRAWIGDINKRLNVKSELGQAIDNAFREEGIVIPFPPVDLHVKSVEADFPFRRRAAKPGEDQ